MPAVAVTSIVLAAVLLAGLAFYLVWVVFILRDVNRALDSTAEAFTSLRPGARGVNEAMRTISENVGRVATALGAEPATRGRRTHVV